MSLLEKLDHVSDNPAISTVEKCRGFTSISCTTGTTNAVDVVIDVRWEVVIDNVSDIVYIEA